MLEDFTRLGMALAVGLLIGLERGWQRRSDQEGNRVAGLRTFALLGLLGGLWGLLASDDRGILLGAGFLAMTILLAAVYAANLRINGDRGLTTLVAAMITFALGVLTVKGYAELAAASAVVTAIILNMKDWLHRGLLKLESSEIEATLKLLLISVVLLPVLPDRGFGPWQFFNPYHFWLLVVLISLISFSGYFFIRISGANRGITLTSLFAGLVSSTALTLYLSRISRKQKLQQLFAAGILIASATMFPRVYLEVAVINLPLTSYLWPPLAGMTLVAGLYVFFIWQGVRRTREQIEFQPRNPFELGVAIRFSLLLAAIMLATMAAQHYLGETGVYLMAGLSGIMDVDAITLSLAKISEEQLAPRVAARAIILAVVVNTLSKAMLAVFLGDRRLRRYVLPGMLLTGGSGILIAYLVG